jgi:hypothetical protein
MRKRLIITAALAAILLSGCGSPPSHQVIEQVWQTEMAEPHMEALVDLLGPQARSLIVSNVEIKDVSRIGSDTYGVSFESRQQLTRPLSELAPDTPANVLRIIRSMFPSGEAGATVGTAGYIKLKLTDAGWIIVDREFRF